MNVKGNYRKVPVLYYLGCQLSSLPDKVKAFNSRFQSVYTGEETNSLNRLQQELVNTKSKECICDITIDENAVCNALRRIDPSKSCSPN